MRIIVATLAAALLCTAPVLATETVGHVCKDDTTGYCHYEYFLGEESNPAAYAHDFTIHASGPDPIVGIFFDRNLDSATYSWGDNFLADPCLPDRPCGSLPVGGDYVVHLSAGTDGAEHFGDCMQYVRVTYGNAQHNYDIVHLDTCNHSVLDMNR
ncbi:MAG: hypothetical protein ACLPYS_18070 [Vulcanimicrobiaceae bacterium]